MSNLLSYICAINCCKDYECLLFFRNNNPTYGALTLSLPFAPSFAWFIYDCYQRKDFIRTRVMKSLPIVHLFHNYKVIRQFAPLHKQIANLKPSKEQDAKIQELEKFKSEFQFDKVFPAMLESAPQFVLQLSILVKKYYSGGSDDLYDPVTILQVGTSVTSVLMTTSGLITDMAIIKVGRLDSITRIVPRRTLWFTYGQIFPLVTLAVTPRLCTMAAMSSFATLENWKFYLAFVLSYMTLHGICCFGFAQRMKNQRKIVSRSAVFIGYFTSLIAPCRILSLKSNFIVWSSLSSSVLLSISLGSMLVIANYQPTMMFEANPSNTYEDKINVLQYYCMVLIPLLLLSNLVYYLIRKLVVKMNRN